MNDYASYAFSALDPKKFIDKLRVSTEPWSLTDLQKNLKYPPYNIRKIAEDKYAIEMAVAGFSKQDIEIDVSGDQLTIKGNLKSDRPEESSFLYHGLALRPFTRMFTLTENVEVKNAKMVNGMLKIMLEALTPEVKSTKIDIQDESEKE